MKEGSFGPYGSEGPFSSQALPFPLAFRLADNFNTIAAISRQQALPWDAKATIACKRLARSLKWPF
jgi:hypothetical protein